MPELNAISLFTGSGGLDYGFEAAGFKTAVAVEWDPDCCATLRANTCWPLIRKDISSVSVEEVVRLAGVHKGGIDLLIGGPPCQPFSKSGYWASGDTKRLNDPRANTLRAYMRFVSELLPKVFVLENVHGINYSGKEEGFLLLYELVEEINRRAGTNYSFAWAVLNTADFGVPQIRRRFFLVANRGGKRFHFPQPTHGPFGDETQLPIYDDRRLPYVTSWDAIGDVRLDNGEELRVRGRWADLLSSIPEGENYLWHTNRKGGLPLFGWRTRYWSFLLKLAKSLPSWTIQAQPGPAIGPFHWHNRLLSVREMARIQTFPEEIRFVGSRHSVQKQIGNAVPCLMAEVLARAICDQFFDTHYRKPEVFAVRFKRPIPQPEPIMPVPTKYRSLIGNHPDHPGTGKGSSRQRQSTPEETLSQTSV
jgi:DNA (cytosine-5)-methyltransferase 1